MQLHDIACHGLQPDLTICIDIDTETGLERARRAQRQTSRIAWTNRRSSSTAVSAQMLSGTRAARILSASGSSMATGRGRGRGTGLEVVEAMFEPFLRQSAPRSRRWSR